MSGGSLLWAMILCFAACFACAGSDTTVERRPDIPHPNLETMEPAVRTQLQTERQLVDALLAGGTSAPEELAEALGQMGRLYHAYDLLDAARACYEVAHEADPGDFRWPYLLGYASQISGDLDAAGGYYEAALRLRPHDAPALARLGAVRWRQNRTDEAEELFRRALQADPDNAFAERGLGEIALRAGEYRQAALRFERVLALQPEAASVHAQMATALRRTGRAEEAAVHAARYRDVPVEFTDPLVEAVLREATGVSTHLRRGHMALKERRLADAAAAYRAAVEYDPDNVTAREYLASTLADLGDLEGGIDHLHQAVLRGSPTARTHFLLGRFLARHGDDETALEHYRKAAELDPQHQDALFNAASALARLGRLEEAAEGYRHVLELNPRDAEARFRRGTLLAGLGRETEARAELERAVADEPDNKQYRDVLAQLEPR